MLISMIQNIGPTQFLLVLFVLGIFMLPKIFYLLSIQKCLSKCSAENRTINPSLVWLMLIPAFSLIWHFVIVINVSKTLQMESLKRKISLNSLQGVGLAICILNIFCIIPYLNIITSFVSLILWIIYWVTIAGVSSQLTLINKN